ncbi:MAG: FAD-binding oxidoreductase [Verrucomicrobiota bacterium]|nr:FAD-binding oxidoreductase [Verrucomicrobiota bacterium]
MLIKPDSVLQLQQLIIEADKVDQADLSNINQLVEHVPEDMTATVQSGMFVEDFQKKLFKRRQWLPLDPPNPKDITIGDLLSANLNGARRFGYGSVRDWVLGMVVVLPDGRLVRNGGKVVKNVAGFDLCRLLIGAQNTLGIIVETTFKLQPLPEMEIHLSKQFKELSQAEENLEKIWYSDLQPVVLDLYRIKSEGVTMVVSFAGPISDVEFQASELISMGFKSGISLGYDAEFRSNSCYVQSVLPSKLMSSLGELGNMDFVARAGNGVYYVREHQFENRARISGVLELEQRLKMEFDPLNKLPKLR